MSQCFLLLDEVVIVEEESGLTSSGNAKQGEIQGVKTATFYQWKYIYYFTVVEEGACSGHVDMLQAANHSQVLEILPPIIIQTK